MTGAPLEVAVAGGLVPGRTRERELRRSLRRSPWVQNVKKKKKGGLAIARLWQVSDHKLSPPCEAPGAADSATKQFKIDLNSTLFLPICFQLRCYEHYHRYYYGGERKKGFRQQLRGQRRARRQGARWSARLHPIERHCQHEAGFALLPSQVLTLQLRHWSHLGIFAPSSFSL